MWLGIIAIIGKVLDLLNPWSKFWADKASESEKRKQKAREDQTKEVKNEGQESMDNFWSARSRRKRG